MARPTGASAAPAPAAPRVALPCRAIAVDGEASLGPDVDAGTLRVDQTFPDHWVTLGEKARLVGKDPRTSRETTFFGPARLRDCVGATEEAWLARGAFESTAGAGEAPGAEEWVVTPQAVVRYGAAKLRVGVHPTGTTVTLVAGAAFLWPPQPGVDAGTGDEGWERLPAGDTTVPSPGRTPAIGRAVERCTALASRARELTAGLFSRDSGAAGPAAVAEQVTTRRLARAACAVASLEVQSAPAGHDDARPGDWTARLAEADAAWRALPIGSAGGVPPRLDEPLLTPFRPAR